jgi:hypothetical protein
MRPEITSILIAVVTTDRDVKHIDRVAKGISHIKAKCAVAPVLVICRERDHAARHAWTQLGATVVAVADYETQDGPNWTAVANMRNLVRHIATQTEYDAVWFVDSDIVITAEVVESVMTMAKEADVVCVPYLLPQFKGGYWVGIQDEFGNVHPLDARALGKDRNIFGGPIGCTLVRKEVLKDVAFELGVWLGVTTEDIGWFINLHRVHPEAVVVSATSFAGHLAEVDAKKYTVENQDPLMNFAAWVLSQPLKNFRPPKNAVYHFGDVVCIVLYRQGPYQVEMFIALPNNKGFPAHSHPNVDSIQVALSGEPDFTLEGQHVNTQEQIKGVMPDGSSPLCGSWVHTKEGQVHGAEFGKEGGTMLNIEYWKNGVEPTCVGCDWDGEPHGEEFKKAYRERDKHLAKNEARP